MFEIVPGLVVVPREDWGADNALPRLGNKVPRSRRTHVICHHTVMPDNSDTSPNIWETEREMFSMMRRLQVVRRKELGADVPYNFVVFFSSTRSKVYICEGRGEDRTGAHTKGHNTAGIALSFAGDFHNNPVNAVEVAERIHLVSFFLGWLRHNPSHPDYGQYSAMRNLGVLRPQDREVFFHRDFKNTACPGKNLEPFLKQLTFLETPKG
jgi:hypothetical protein